jgi:hypothetical protein
VPESPRQSSALLDIKTFMRFVHQQEKDTHVEREEGFKIKRGSGRK